MPRPRYNLDVLGMILSLACAVHCAIMPIILVLGAFTGLHFLADPMLEHTIIIASMLIAGASLIPHYFHHKRKEVLIVASTGFALIFIGHWHGMAWLHTILMVAGGTAIAFSHLLNMRFCRGLH